jgi:integrase
MAISSKAAAVPSYRRHKASGQAVVTLNGVDHYLGPWNTHQSRAEYDRVLNEWLARGRQLGEKTRNSDTDAMLMKELVRGYHAHIVATAPQLEVGVRMALKHVKAMYGETPASKFGPVAFQAVRHKLLDTKGPRGKLLCVTTVRKILGTIKQMIAWGVANEMLPGDALHRLQAVPKLRANQPGVMPGKKVLPVSEDDVQAILPHLVPATRAMVEVQCLTGMRPGEVCRLTTGQIDRSGDVWIYRPREHKTASQGKSRMVPLGPRVQEILKPWLRADPDAPLFSPREAAEKAYAARRNPKNSDASRARRNARWRDNHRPKRGKRLAYRVAYTNRTYAKAVARACDKAGIDVFGPNRIRHAFATMVRKHHGLEAAQILLGHARADVTQVYAERDEAKAIEVARKIG